MGTLSGVRFSGNLFGSPILDHMWSEGHIYNGALRKSILSYEKEAPGNARSNMGGWQSEGGGLKFCGTAGEYFMKHVLEVIDEATARFYAGFARPLEPHSWTLTAWANVNRRGDYNVVHTHPSSTWSGVYYVDGGEPDPDSVGTGLELFDPNPARANLFFPDVSVSNVIFKPQPGAMLLFPSYVPHGVPPHKGSGARISIAFNARKEPFP